MRKFYIVLSDGTRCFGWFKDADDARDTYEIFYGMTISEITEVGK